MRIRIYLLLLFFAFSSFTYSQTYSTKQIDSLIEYGDSLYRIRGNYSELAKWHKKMILLAKKNNDPNGEIKGLLLLSNTLWNMDENEKSIKILNSIEENPYLQTNSNHLSKYYQEKGMAYGNLKLYDIANKLHFKAIKIVKEKSSFTEKKRNKLLAYSYNSVAFFYDELKKIDSSFYYYNISLKIAQSPFTHLNISRLYLKHELSIDSAKYHIDKADQLLRKKKYPELQQILYKRVYGTYLQKTGQTALAEKNLTEALESSIKLKRYQAIVSSYKCILEFYKSTKNTEKENFYLQKSHQFNDSIESVRVKNTNFVISDLLKKNEEIINNQDGSIVKLILLLLLFGFVTILMVQLFIKYKRKFSKKKVELQSTKDENKKLNEKLEFTSDELDSAAKNNDPSFLTKFQFIHADFYNNLIKRYSNLTKSDLILCAYIYLNYSSKEIATFTFVQHKTIQTQKNRLRKKMNIPSETNLHTYFKNEF